MLSPIRNQSKNVDGSELAPGLVGWKEISTYLGKAERTSKRWGKDRELPIRRVPGGSSATVYAYPTELNKWLAAGSHSDLAAGEKVNEIVWEPEPGESVGQELLERPVPVVLIRNLDGQQHSWHSSPSRWPIQLCAFTGHSTQIPR